MTTAQLPRPQKQPGDTRPASDSQRDLVRKLVSQHRGQEYGRGMMDLHELNVPEVAAQLGDDVDDAAVNRAVADLLRDALPTDEEIASMGAASASAWIDGLKNGRVLSTLGRLSGAQTVGLGVGLMKPEWRQAVAEAIVARARQGGQSSPAPTSPPAAGAAPKSEGGAMTGITRTSSSRTPPYTVGQALQKEDGSFVVVTAVDPPMRDAQGESWTHYATTRPATAEESAGAQRQMNMRALRQQISAAQAVGDQGRTQALRAQLDDLEDEHRGLPPLVGDKGVAQARARRADVFNQLERAASVPGPGDKFYRGEELKALIGTLRQQTDASWWLRHGFKKLGQLLAAAEEGQS